MERYVNVEINENEAEKFRNFLKANNYKFETSSCYNLVHFEVYADDNGIRKADKFLESL